MKYYVRFISLTAAVCLTAGCAPGKAKLENQYNFSERTVSVAESGDDPGLAVPFASDLCVIFEEGDGQSSGVNAEAAGLFDITDSEAMFSKNAFERLYPASTTKIMTALLAIKYGNLSDEVTVTEDAVITERGATLCGIKPGDVLTMEQLLYGLMLPSGNDAGAAIAVHMADSIEGFADLMNEEAHRIGATGTHFVNPHGLTDEQHYTTAYDLYLMFNEALKYPEFRKITGTTAYTADYKNGQGEAVSKTWSGGNWYMTGERDTPDGLTVFGGKTGTTSAAGYCLVMASRDESDKEYVSVVLKAGSRPGLYENMTNIISKIVN